MKPCYNYKTNHHSELSSTCKGCTNRMPILTDKPFKDEFTYRSAPHGEIVVNCKNYKPKK